MPFDQSGARRRRFFFFAVIALVAFFILGAVVMYLWNAILPEVTNARKISYPQATGLLLLSRILFGSFRNAGYRYAGKSRMHLGDKWKSMTPEERARFRESWKARCNDKK